MASMDDSSIALKSKRNAGLRLKYPLSIFTFPVASLSYLIDPSVAPARPRREDVQHPRAINTSASVPLCHDSCCPWSRNPFPFPHVDYYRQSYENLKKVCKLLQARDDENRRIIAEMAERISELVRELHLTSLPPLPLTSISFLISHQERLVAVQGNEIEELSGDPSSSKKSHRRSREIKPLAVIDEKVHQNKPSHHHEGGERRAEREKSRDKDNETSPDHTSNSSRERGSSRSSSGGKR